MKRGTIAAKALTWLLALGMLSQNAVTVYADEPEGGEPEAAAVTITYQAGEHGSVSPEEETITSLEDIQGSTATPDEGYDFVNWQDADGNAVSAEAQFVPSLDALPDEDVTYTATFAEKEPEEERDDTDEGASDEGEESPDEEDDTEGELNTYKNDVLMPIDGAEPTVGDGKAYVVSTQTEYDSLADAIQAAATTDTIYLGEGTFSTYAADGSDTGIAKDKNLTIIGSGTDKTTWNIGTGQNDAGGQGNGDFSLRDAAGITFKNMTLQAGVKPDGSIDDRRDYLGFTHIQNGDAKTVVEDCVIKGKTAYWGYKTAIFKNTIFDEANSTYAVWLYSAYDYTFDGCTFNAKGFGGHVLHAYRDYDSRPEGSRTVTINYSNNKVTFTGLFQYKRPIDIKDGNSNYGGNDYIINISGNNSVSGYAASTKTCSRLFDVENTNGSGHPATVNIEGTTVWTKGAMVSHEMDFDEGSYNNGEVTDTDNQYTEGYKDNAYTITETEEVDEVTGLKYKKIHKVCNYCGWSSDKNEAEKENKTLPADILINKDNKTDGTNDDTEKSAVTKVKAGQKVALIGALQVSDIADQMEAIEVVFKNPDGSSISLSDLQYSFSATLTVPSGMTLPEDVKVVPDGLAETFTADNGTVSADGKSVTVKFSLTDAAKENIKTYEDLKGYVKAAGTNTDGWLRVTIPDVQIDAGVAAGTRLTVTGTVEGSFEGTATGSVRTFTFPYAWNGTQWADGKDAAATDDTTIRLTVEVTAKSKPDEPSKPDHKDNDGGYGDITLYKVDEETSKPLAGARIALYRSNGDYVSTYTTGSNGEIEIKNAAYSMYYFQEMEAPEGYVLDNTHHNFVLDKDHPNVTIKFTNAKKEVPIIPVDDTPASVEPIDSTEAAITTGDSSNMTLYGVVFLMALIALAAWTRKARVE